MLRQMKTTAMKNASRLYDALIDFVGQSAWSGQRHAYVLVWMVIGLISVRQPEFDSMVGAC